MDLTREQQNRAILILRHRVGVGFRRIGEAIGLTKCAVECRYWQMMGTTRAKAQDRYDRFCRPDKLSTDSSCLSLPVSGGPLADPCGRM